MNLTKSNFYDDIIDKFGKEILVTDDEQIEAISTGSLSLDASIGIGGIPIGRVTEIWGVEGCLTGDTHIMYRTIKPNGTRPQNSKGGTLKRLYEVFNRIKKPGLGFYLRKNTLDSIYTIPSVNENNCVFHNRISNVVYSGKKDVFLLETEYGKTIKATKDHKFYIGNSEYKSLSELAIGDSIYIHKNLSFIVKPDKIKLIKYGGVEDTYDIQCQDPYNNFVGNGIVVHNSGKTTIALDIARNAIKMGKKVLYVDAENMVDYFTVAQLLGEELDKKMLILLHPDSAEDNLGACEMGIHSEEFGLIVLDSIGALSPGKEREKELTDLTVGITPKLLSLFLRRNMSAIRTSKVAFLFINQVRDKIGAYIPTFEPPGGHALKHFSSVIIALSRGQEIKQGDVSVGLNIKFVVKKNKMSAPFRSFIIPLFFGKGIDTNRDLISFAEMLGVLKKRGSYYVFEGETIGQGVVKTITYLEEHKDVLDKIRELAYNVVDTGSIVPEELSETELIELEKEGENAENSKN